MARLMSIHKNTHPMRIARRYGVTEEFVRQLESRYPFEELAPVSEALEAFYGRSTADFGVNR